MSNDLDSQLDSVVDGNLAALAFATLKAKASQLEENALATLLQGHYSGTLTEGQMRAGIAEIAALRKLANSLQRDLRKSQVATEHLLGV